MFRSFGIRAVIATTVVATFVGFTATAGQAASTTAPAPSATTTPTAATAAPLTDDGPNNPPKYQWTEAHQNVQLTGVSSNPISTANAAQLGVHWMTNLESPSLSSPVVGYNQALSETLVYAGHRGRLVLAPSTQQRQDRVVGQPGQPGA